MIDFIIWLFAGDSRPSNRPYDATDELLFDNGWEMIVYAHIGHCTRGGIFHRFSKRDSLKYYRQYAYDIYRARLDNPTKEIAH